MAKTDLTIELEKQIWEHTKKPMGVFGCFEVTIGWYGKERVDYMTYETNGIWRCYEIKVSKSDFKSKAKVSFIGHYNYYVMPEELFELIKDEIPSHIGVYVSKGKYLICKKNPKKQKLGVDEQILKDSMIRSLYRESERVISSNDPTVVEKLRKQVSRAERNAKQYNDLCNKLYMKYGHEWRENLYK